MRGTTLKNPEHLHGLIKKKINTITRQVKVMNKQYDVSYELDHIVPLVHPMVCGLHCEDNLEIITAEANCQKSNNHWPNMWIPQQCLLFDCSPHQMSLNY